VAFHIPERECHRYRSAWFHHHSVVDNVFLGHLTHEIFQEAVAKILSVAVFFEHERRVRLFLFWTKHLPSQWYRQRLRFYILGSPLWARYHSVQKIESFQIYARSVWDLGLIASSIFSMVASHKAPMEARACTINHGSTDFFRLTSILCQYLCAEQRQRQRRFGGRVD